MMSDVTSQTISSKRRAGHAKTKTGCITCKKRRVKCDESKPVCNRCVRFGVECDGYRITGTNHVTGSKCKRLIPKPPAIVFIPPTELFSNGQEHYCFQFFCDKTASRLSGYFDTGLWSQLVPQACQSDAALRHAVVALGALDFLSEISQTVHASGTGNPHKAYEEAQKHRRFALQEYGVAIRHMRNSTSGRKADIRRILLSCIVITCFEIFLGNNQSAMAQIQSGLALMEDWQIYVAQSRSGVLELSSPSPYTIEDEIHQAMCRLDIQVMSFVDVRPKRAHERMKRYGVTSMRSMPPTFSDFREARAFLELIMRRIMHFRSSLSGITDYNGCLRIVSSYLRPRDGAYSDQQRLKEELECWHHAFKPLWEDDCSSIGQWHASMSLMLKIQYLTSKFVIDAIPLNPSEAQAFATTSTTICREIVTLSQILLQHPDTRNAETKFSFDFGLVTPLYITGMCCRDSQIRRRAIILLESYGRREGLWDGVLAAKVLSWVEVVVEEEIPAQKCGLANGVIEMRYNFDLQAQSVHIWCRQWKSGIEEPLSREITIEKTRLI